MRGSLNVEIREGQLRGCGAHYELQQNKFFMKGSSPRVRGSHRQRHPGQCVGGIIPAGAGLTCSCSSRIRCGRDHPRGCGAHFSQSDTTRLGMGSSPRVRGSLGGKTPFGYRFGIIPAGAGLTDTYCKTVRRLQDHPRGCGAHYAL